LAISALVEVIAYHGVPGRLSQPSFVRVWGRGAGFEVLDVGGGPVLALQGVVDHSGEGGG